jgi:hypothetical protein
MATECKPCVGVELVQLFRAAVLVDKPRRVEANVPREACHRLLRPYTDVQAPKSPC